MGLIFFALSLTFDGGFWKIGRALLDWLLGGAFQPQLPGEFYAFVGTAAALATVFSLPIFPYCLDIDDQGIRKNSLGDVYAIAWPDISSVRVTGSQNPFFQAVLVEITLLHDVSKIRNRRLLLTPARYGASATELMSVIEDGMRRWGSSDRPKAPLELARASYQAT